MNSEKKKVLIIDDQEEIRELIDVTLRGTEFDVLKAVNGKEGIQIAKEQKPDLILLDIAMPVFDGYMTCKVLKRNSVTKEIPVVFLTGKKTKENINAALKVGGSDYIVKPFSPSELLVRLRRIEGSRRVKRAEKTKESKPMEVEKKSPKEAPIPKHLKKPLINIARHGEVVVLSTGAGCIVLENCQIFRDAFANIVSDGIFKVVLDTSEIQKIDGAGLALLISINESLKNYGGELRITFPPKDVNNRFSFIKFNDLFQTFNNLQDAIESFQGQDSEIDTVLDSHGMNICLSCTFINAAKSRYCGFCGTNLILGKGEKIFEILGRIITRRLISETGINDMSEINRSRNIMINEYNIPSKFKVEIIDDNLNVSYESHHTDAQEFENSEQIAIEAPVMNKKLLPVKPGMQLRLANPQIGTYTKFDTKIEAVDPERRRIIVHYSEDAVALHSYKNFSVSPKLPIPISLVVPTFQYAGKIFEAKILELSRMRMIVFSEENIPLNQCLAVKFDLPEGREISSPLVIAQKGLQQFMYALEFNVIDEKESSIITQYMYKRQIELAKSQ